MQTMKDRVKELLKNSHSLTVAEITEQLNARHRAQINTICNDLADEEVLRKSDNKPYTYQFLNAGNIIASKRKEQEKPQSKRKTLSGEETDLGQIKEYIEGKNVLYIIPCCNTKLQNGDSSIDNPTHGIIDLVNDNQLSKQLNKGRIQALTIAGGTLNLAKIGAEFECENTTETNACYLEARDRYNGKLYSKKIKSLLHTNSHKNIFIMSALYGILTCDDNIQNYNLEMTDAYTIWEEGLPLIIDSCARSKKANIIIGLFPKGTDSKPTYRHIFELLPERKKCEAFWIHPTDAGSGTLHRLGQALLYLIEGGNIPEGTFIKIPVYNNNI